MNWEDESYVKLYTRETATTLLIGWTGWLVLTKAMTKIDRAGVLELVQGTFDEQAAVLADQLRIPYDICRDGLLRLIGQGSPAIADPPAVIRDNYFILVNFLPAQEARSSDPQRKRDSRARRRAMARAVDLGILPQTVTDCDHESQNVTDAAELEPASGGEGARGGSPLAGHRPTTGVPTLAEVTNRDNGSRNVTGASHAVTLSLDESTRDESRSLLGGSDREVPRFDFEKVYRLYPHKRGKAQGLKACKRKITTEAHWQSFVTAVERMAEAWAGHDTKFCPYFSTFVNQERYLDDDIPRPRNGVAAGTATGYASAPGAEAYTNADDIGFD